MAVDVSRRPAAALQRWLCWRCRQYLGEKCPEAQAAVVVVCARCHARNPLQPR